MSAAKQVIGFSIEKLVSESQNCHIYLARGLGGKSEKVFLRVLQSRLTPQILSQLHTAFDIHQKLSNLPGVLPVIEMYEDGGKPVVVLEAQDFIGSLAELLENKKLTVSEFLNFAVQMTRTIGEIHTRGYLHRCIRPSSFGYSEDGKVVLSNFEQATTIISGSEEDLKSGQQGFYPYMSPEQTRRVNRLVDERSDLYSLGATFYEMLTGTPPFDSKDPSELIYAHIARQPQAPNSVNPGIPEVISNIILKLLAKNADGRYNSAFGLLNDLENCLRQLDGIGTIAKFELAKNDFSRRLVIPQKLYGREEQLAELKAIFDRASQGDGELVLVSGYSGTGKTSFVKELQPRVIRKHGFFLSGKYNQFQTDVPFSAFVQALEKMVRHLLATSPEETAIWKEKILRVLGTSGRVLTDLVPQLALIIGPQPEVPDLGLVESRARFNTLLRGLFSVLASPENPLLLFLDDLQWIDVESLTFLKALLQGGKNILIVGTYRDNEVSGHHPLLEFVKELEASKKITTIHMGQLEVSDLQSLLADTFHREPSECEKIAQVVLKKTHGNPFFVGEFLNCLFRERALHQTQAGTWDWNPDHINSINVTDNVIDLMSKRISSLPLISQELLRLGAFLGHSFGLITLAEIIKLPVQVVIQGLVKPIEEGLIQCSEEFIRLQTLAYEVEAKNAQLPHLLALAGPVSFTFSHDRIQQAAYETASQEFRLSLHLEIGMMLKQNDRSEERLLEMVNHLNIGAPLLNIPQEREELAELNLEAAKKARHNTAFRAAAQYAEAGLGLLDPDQMKTKLSFELHLMCGESKTLCGEPEAAEKYLEKAIGVSTTDFDKARVFRLQVLLFSSLGRYNDAVSVGINGLNMFGMDLPGLNDETVLATFQSEYEKFRAVIAKQSIESLYDIPVNDDEYHACVLSILGSMLDSAIIGPSHYLGIIVYKLVNLSVEKGHTPNSAFGLVWSGVIELTFMNYDDAYGLAQLALKLLEKKFQNTGLMGSMLNMHSVFLACLRNSWKENSDTFERCYQECIKSGDHLYAAYISTNSARMSIMWNGSTLKDCIEYMDSRCARTREINNSPMADSIRAYSAFPRALRGLTSGLGSRDFDDYKEEVYIQAYSGVPLLFSLTENFKMMVSVIAGDFDEAIAIFDRTDFFPVETFLLQAIENRIFGVLTMASVFSKATEPKKAAYLAKMEASLVQLGKLAKQCPKNFGSISKLAEAELASVKGESFEKVIALYEDAVFEGRAYGLVNFAAIAAERAALFCESRNLRRLMVPYLQDAYQYYEKWGALAKLKQMEKKYGILDEVRTSSAASSVETVDVDLENVMKAAQAISGEIVWEKLLTKMMNTMLEASGAETAALALINQHGVINVRAVTTAEETQLINQGIENFSSASASVLRYVERSQEPLIIADALRDERFQSEPYIYTHRIRSVCCLPIKSQGRSFGFLYMENNLLPRVFTEARLQLLNLLASQAAVALENSALYMEMEQRVNERTQELQAIQTQLTHNSRMSAIGEMAGGIAHEINNPLAILNLHIRNVRKHMTKNTVTAEFLEDSLAEMDTTIQRITKIISSLRTISRDSSKTEIQEVPFRGMLDDVLALCTEKFKNHSVKLEIRDNGLLDQVVKCNSVQISQVFLNLMNNAYDAIEKTPSPWIRVSLGLSGDKLAISVTDSGKIDPAVAEKLFQPFFTTKDIGKGTGLGLSISRGLMKQNGGSLDLDMSGQNTCFVITIPL